MAAQNHYKKIYYDVREVYFFLIKKINNVEIHHGVREEVLLHKQSYNLRNNSSPG